MIGKTISHYQIHEKLGAGGMGVVYKAQDTRLHRTVALKFLPSAMTADEEAKERFIREAETASSLQHQNICTIHDIDQTTDGQLFIVMDFYQGVTLKEKIARGPIETREVIDISAQIASGLAKAHEQGIVHRDIKPANIFLTDDGVVKILDFGLAKLGQQTRLTKTGTTLGTILYMSPEQARGEQVDHRTDIWSLGVLLYEMQAGRPPFHGEYEQAVIYAIINEPTPPLTGFVADPPRRMDAVVSTCLQKDPSARYQNASELLTDLENLRQGRDAAGAFHETGYRWGRGTKRRNIFILLMILCLVTAVAWFLFVIPHGWHNPEPMKRLVVLPFENLGPAEEEFFADGMTEELTTRLASLSGLEVICRTSAVQYARTEKPLAQIGRELRVGFALEGSVRWAHVADGSSRVRITSHLTRIADNTTLWAEMYDRVIDDIFQVQSEISQKVVENLNIALLTHERHAVERPPTQSLEAYQAFLRARYFEGRPHFTLENWQRVVEGYQQAVALDPGFALAFAELARAHARFYYFWYDHSPDRLRQAQEAAARAMELAPQLPAVHLALGYYQLYAYRDPIKAMAELDIAARGMPNNSDLYQAKSAVAMVQGDWAAALENSRKALNLSPRDGSLAVDLAEYYWVLRRYTEATQTCDLAIELTPDDAWPYLIKTFSLWSWKGSAAESYDLLKSVPRDHAWSPWAWFWQFIYQRRYLDAVASLSSTPDPWIRTKCWAMPKLLLAAFAYKLAGEKEKSRRAYETARPLLEEEIKRCPDDPRYRSSLGIAYASLGRTREAIEQGRKAVELLSISRDAFYGIPPEEDLAFIYAVSGEKSAAISQLDHLLSIPSWFSAAWIQMDPQWNSLRGESGFIRLLQKYGKERE